MDAEPKTDADRIFGYLALGKKDELKKMNPSGDLKAYRAFALAYLGERVELSGDFNSTVATAMALYATGKEDYRRELLEREHFGFWGTLHYRVLDLLSVSQINGFEGLRAIACPYLDRITPGGTNWEKAVLADYYLLCNETPRLPSNYSGMLPLAGRRARPGEGLPREGLLGRGGLPPEGLAGRRLGGDFYNTEYVVWVLRSLNVTYDYDASLGYLSGNLTWMTSTKDPKTGNPVYYNVPTYYLAYALLVFKDFGMERELNETLRLLGERQYPNGAFPPYTQARSPG